MLVLHNKTLQQQLVPFTYNQKQVGQASHVLVICIQKKITPEYITTYFNRVKELRGTADSILNPFKDALIVEFSKMNLAEIAQWATKQAYLALGNLMTVCAIERIDACPMEGFVPSGYDALLGLEQQGLQSVLVMPVGYRAADDMFSDFKKVRRNLEDSIIEML
jgi:nitroreductase